MFCQRLQLRFFHFFPTLFRYRHALQCAKAMILAAQAPTISPHSFLFRNRSINGRFSSAIRANHCFFLLFRPTPSPSVARRLRRCAAPLGRAHGSVLCTLLCGPPRFASWASGLRYCFAVSSPLGALHPSFRPTPSPSVARRLRRCAAPLGRAHGSVLCTRLCGPPRFASWASGLRYCFAVSSPLGASHPFFGLPPHLRWCVGFAAALPRLTSESACVFRSQFSAEPFRRFSAFGV